jgi:hypothetical protein
LDPGKHRAGASTDDSTRVRRLFKKAVQQGRSERRDDAYSVPYVEPLSDVRTPLADFFNSLLQHRTEYADIQTVAGIDLPTEFQGSPFFSITC